MLKNNKIMLYCSQKCTPLIKHTRELNMENCFKAEAEPKILLINELFDIVNYENRALRASCKHVICIITEDVNEELQAMMVSHLFDKNVTTHSAPLQIDLKIATRVSRIDSLDTFKQCMTK